MGQKAAIDLRTCYDALFRLTRYRVINYTLKNWIKI